MSLEDFAAVRAGDRDPRNLATLAFAGVTTMAPVRRAPWEVLVAGFDSDMYRWAAPATATASIGDKADAPSSKSPSCGFRIGFDQGLGPEERAGPWHCIVENRRVER